MSVALVLGGAACVWDDVEAALALGQFHGVVACNDVGAMWPGRLDAWASLHGDKMGIWTARRIKAGHAPCRALYGHIEAKPHRKSALVTHTTEFRLEGQLATGSSGLFAVKVALVDLGFDKAVVCGIPMTTDAHFFDRTHWRGAASHRLGWIEAASAIKDRVRSMSGWTAERLGQPTEAWLAGD